MTIIIIIIIIIIYKESKNIFDICNNHLYLLNDTRSYKYILSENTVTLLLTKHSARYCRQTTMTFCHPVKQDCRN